MKHLGDSRDDPLCCEEINCLLVDYVDGTASDSTRARFNAHLRACSQCRTYLAQYRKTIELVTTCSELREPNEVARRMLMRFDARFEAAEALRPESS